MDCHPDLTSLDSTTRAHIAQEWTAMGLAEHASVASFARFTLQLMAVGAPAELLHAAQLGAADEVCCDGLKPDLNANLD